MILSDDGYADVKLVGTVHISERSRDRVISAVTTHEPDVVAVELDPKRYETLTTSTSLPLPVALGLDILDGDLTLPGAAAKLLFSFGLRNFDDAVELSPGEADFIPAIEMAEEQGIPATLIDADGRDTLNGLGEHLTPDHVLSSFLDRDLRDLLAAYQSFREVVADHPVDSNDPIAAINWLEDLPYDDLEQLFDAYTGLLPDGLVDHMIHDRDQRLAGHIHWHRLNGEFVLAVMGRGHVPGVKRLLENPASIPNEYIVEPPAVGAGNK